MNTILEGKETQSRAATILGEMGYSILEENKKISKIEIDIITNHREKDRIIFWEVKKVHRRNFLNGYFPFSRQQWKRYVRATQIGSRYHYPQKKIHIGLAILDQNNKALFIEPNFSYFP